MTKKVVLTIIGTQKVDSMNDKIEVTTVGAIEETNDSYVIKYKEEQEPPLMPNDITLTVKKDSTHIELIRSGSTNSCLIIERFKRNQCHYGTMYGEMLMGISGKSIELNFNDDEGTLKFAYDIDFNGALASKNEVNISYKSN